MAGTSTKRLFTRKNMSKRMTLMRRMTKAVTAHHPEIVCRGPPPSDMLFLLLSGYRSSVFKITYVCFVALKLMIGQKHASRETEPSGPDPTGPDISRERGFDGLIPIVVHRRM